MMKIKPNWIGKVLNSIEGKLILSNGLSQVDLRIVLKYLPQAIDHVEKETDKKQDSSGGRKAKRNSRK
jgi:hypothetical protein